MSESLSKNCPRCRRVDWTDFSTCRYCGTRYDTVWQPSGTGQSFNFVNFIKSWPGYIITLAILFLFMRPALKLLAGVAISQCVHNASDNIAQESEILRTDPTNYDALLKRAEAFKTMMRPSEAVEDYNTAIALHPTNRELYLKRAELYDLLNQADLARKDRATAAGIR